MSDIGSSLAGFASSALTGLGSSVFGGPANAAPAGGSISTPDVTSGLNNPDFTAAYAVNPNLGQNQNQNQNANDVVAQDFATLQQQQQQQPPTPSVNQQAPAWIQPGPQPNTTTATMTPPQQPDVPSSGNLMQPVSTAPTQTPAQATPPAQPAPPAPDVTPPPAPAPAPPAPAATGTDATTGTPPNLGPGYGMLRGDTSESDPFLYGGAVPGAKPVQETEEGTQPSGQLGGTKTQDTAPERGDLEQFGPNAGQPRQGGGQQGGQGQFGPQSIMRLIMDYMMGGPGAVMQDLMGMMQQGGGQFGGQFGMGGRAPWMNRQHGWQPGWSGGWRGGPPGWHGGRGGGRWPGRGGPMGGWQGFPFGGPQMGQGGYDPGLPPSVAQRQDPNVNPNEQIMTNPPISGPTILPNVGGPRAGQMPSQEEIAGASKPPQSDTAGGEKTQDRVKGDREQGPARPGMTPQQRDIIQTSLEQTAPGSTAAQRNAPTPQMVARSRPAGTDTRPTEGSSPYLAQQRQQSGLAQAMQDPRNRLKIAAMMETEDAQDPAAPFEAFANRMNYSGQSFDQMLSPRFYGPMRTGRYQQALARLQNNPRAMARYNQAIDTVLAGSNMLGGATDQGNLNDPNGRWAGGRVMRGHEVYNDWGGGPGGHAGAAQFRKQQQQAVQGAQGGTTAGKGGTTVVPKSPPRTAPEQGNVREAMNRRGQDWRRRLERQAELASLTQAGAAPDMTRMINASRPDPSQMVPMPPPQETPVIRPGSPTPSGGFIT